MDTSTPHPCLIPGRTGPMQGPIDALRRSLAHDLGVQEPTPDPSGSFSLPWRGVDLDFLCDPRVDAFLIRIHLGRLRYEGGATDLDLLTDNLRLSQAGTGALCVDAERSAYLALHIPMAELRWGGLPDIVRRMAERALAWRERLQAEEASQ